MFTWIRIKWATFELGVRDRGFAAPRWYWNPKLCGWYGGYEERVPPHSRCGTPLRVGIVRSNGYLEYWCYRCGCYVYDENGDDKRGDGGGGKVTPPTPTPGDDALSLKAKKIADDAFAKMRNPS